MRPRTLTQANEMVALAGLMMRQAFRGVLTELDKSPGLARHLADPAGVELSHSSLNKGHIPMRVEDGLTMVTIQAGLPMPAP